MIEPTKGNAGKADATEAKGLMIEYGITNIPVDCFHVGGYKYTNLKDAISQAKRLQSLDA